MTTKYTVSTAPATQGMLYRVRDELKSQMLSIGEKVKSHDKILASNTLLLKAIEKRFDSIDKRFDSIDKRFDSIDKRFDSVDKRFDSVDKRVDSLHHEMKSGFASTQAEIHAVKLQSEEQRRNSSFVMDHLNVLFDRQERVEDRLDNLDKES